jgi:hypothetical protein
MTTIQLTLAHSTLHVGDHMLMYFYPAGDVDTCRWPLASDPTLRGEHEYRLAVALFDAREMGHLPEGAFVALPDGMLFDFDLIVSRPNPMAHAQDNYEY